MRLKLLSTILTFLLILSAGTSFSQNTPVVVENTTVTELPKAKIRNYRQRDTVKNTDATLNGQYKYMLSRSRTTADGYKSIAPARLNELWKNVNDSLRKERAERKGLLQKFNEQGKTVNYLKTEISGKETSINSYSDKLNEIKFLGISFDKGTYNLMVWSIIGLLVIALIIVIATSGRKISEGNHRIQLYDEISEEYQTYKSKTVEKERKLARELQDERNKVAELESKR